MTLPVLAIPDRNLVSSRFSSAAERYDSYAEHQKQIAGKLIDVIGETGCSRILELGCGTGILSRLLIKLYPHAQMVLTDSAPGMVSVCRTRVNPSSLVRHSIWDFEGSMCRQSFDLVASSCSLQWLKKPWDFGQRLHKLVSPGGLTVHAIPVKGMLKEFEDSFSGTGMDWPTLNYLSGDEWDRILIESGFRILESFSDTFPVRYSSPADALRSLRGIGASLTGHAGSGQVPPAGLRNALDYYRSNFCDSDGMVSATYRVHFIRAART